MLDLQTQTEQIIDIATQDQLISAGFIDAGEAEGLVQAFEDWIRSITTSMWPSRPTSISPTTGGSA